MPRHIPFSNYFAGHSEQVARICIAYSGSDLEIGPLNLSTPMFVCISEWKEAAATHPVIALMV